MPQRAVSVMAVAWPILLCLSATAAMAENATPPRRPNIVFIFIDDLGYGDLSVYRPGGLPGPKTENIDALAQQGVRFTQFYVNSPICSPSRVAVITGQYPQRHRVYGHFASRQRNRQRGMVDYLSPEAVTLPRLLKQAGYATAHYGKWHMGGGRDVDDAPRPSRYGFDDALVSMEGLGPRILHGKGLGSRKLGPAEDIQDVPKHRMTEVWVDRALEFIEAHREGPFYVNLWPRDVHDPFLPSQQQLEEIEPDVDFPNPDQWRQFFAVLKELDQQIGRLVRGIDRLGLGEDTMIVLTGDNGPTAWDRYYRGGTGPGSAPGYTAGLRGRKWSLYEGGIRQPLLVRWPGRVPAGEVNDTTVACGVDLLPSLCAVAGATLPASYRSDGVDLGAALLGRSRPMRARPIFWEYNSLGGNLQPGLPDDRSPTLAIRDGDWKLLVDANGSGLELYDLAADREEKQNVAERYPRRAERLSRQLLRWYHDDLPEPHGEVAKPTRSDR